MPIFIWNAQYSVNIDSIDEQHKVLISMINDFYELIKIKSNNELISDLIKNMKEYTITHFTKEEDLFDQFNYPNAKAHKKEHSDFINKVNELEQKLKNNKVILSFEITNFLKKWLINHIQGTDMKYSKFLIDKGVK